MQLAEMLQVQTNKPSTLYEARESVQMLLTMLAIGRNTAPYFI